VIGRAQVKRAAASSPALWRRVRIVVVLSLVAAAAGALWLALDDRFYVYHADVVGTARLSPDEVFRASGLPGIHVLWVRSAEVEARLLDALPGIERARVACGLPAKCTISVAERQPRVTWDEDGRSWWIDAEGVVFSPSPSPPLVGGDAGGATGWTVQGPLPRDADGRLEKGVRVALAELWVAGAEVPASLTYVPARGLVFADERGWRVIVGQGPGMGERLQVLEWLAADLEARGLAPRFVDVRFVDAPYYSLTNDW